MPDPITAPAMDAFVDFRSPVTAFIAIETERDLERVHPDALGTLAPEAIKWLTLRLRSAREMRGYAAEEVACRALDGPLLPADVAGLLFVHALATLPEAGVLRGDPAVPVGREVCARRLLAAVVSWEVAPQAFVAAGWVRRLDVSRMDALERIVERAGAWEIETLRPALGGDRRDARSIGVFKLWGLGRWRTGDKRLLFKDARVAARRAAGPGWRHMSSDERSADVKDAIAQAFVLLKEGPARSKSSGIYFDLNGNPRISQTTLRDGLRAFRDDGRQRAAANSKRPALSLDARVPDAGDETTIGNAVAMPSQSEQLRSGAEDPLDAAEDVELTRQVTELRRRCEEEGPALAAQFLHRMEDISEREAAERVTQSGRPVSRDQVKRAAPRFEELARRTLKDVA